MCYGWQGKENITILHMELKYYIVWKLGCQNSKSDLKSINFFHVKSKIDIIKKY